MVSDPHAVAWTFNIRGSDVAHTPLPLAFAIVPKDGPSEPLCRSVASWRTTCVMRLEELAAVREPQDASQRDLPALGAEKRLVRLDQATAADALARTHQRQRGGKVARGRRSDRDR